MKMTMLFATILVALLPGMALAACDGHQEARMTCAEGTVWDAESSSCQPTSS
jgi:hypothetical protein